ncbi:MAG: hypothetical protein K6F49_06880 [Saccharofermentans sp.]|nr:hypothetical protein [Saccharofermentans sp.]
MRLIVFVLEADKHSQTDWIYIQETVKRFYEADKETSIKTIFMGGRSNYNSKPVLRSIRELKRGNSKNITIIYCVDTDRYESAHDQAKELNDISQYCSERQYELIWFCHDIEEVFIGEAISSSDKTKTANSFRKSGKIGSITETKLKRRDYAPKTSNILGVLDRIFTRKK